MHNGLSDYRDRVISIELAALRGHLVNSLVLDQHGAEALLAEGGAPFETRRQAPINGNR